MLKISLKAVMGLVVFTVVMGTTVVAQAGLAIIANPENPVVGITTEQAANIYLGKARTFPNGDAASPIDQTAGNPTRSKFYKTVVKKNERELKTYWSRLVFTGKGQPPKELADDAAVKAWVANNPNALGYVDGKSLDPSVKVLLILP